jgi:HSP20 family protein
MIRPAKTAATIGVNIRGGRELAHANLPGERHAKCWQDVDDLLASGIDVYTALHVAGRSITDLCPARPVRIGDRGEAAPAAHGRLPPGRQLLHLPGISAESIDLTVEQNVLTVRAERAPVKADGAEMIVAERPYGTFTRQVFLGESLDADHIAADYAAGVLTLTIPVREAAKPRSIHVTSSDEKQAVTA